MTAPNLLSTGSVMPGEGITPETIAPLLTYSAGRVDLTVLQECDSTNLHLLRLARDEELKTPNGTVILAEHQTAGRGRRGRAWYQAENALAFSLLWSIPAGQSASGLSLTVGLAVAAALGHNTQLKWPNDILLNGRKVAGILIESVPGTANNTPRFVIGIGINLDGTSNLPEEVAALAAGLGNTQSPLIQFAQVLDQLVVHLDQFTANGFSIHQAAWQARHAYQDQPVNLYFSEGSIPIQGICRGIDRHGELLIETPVGIQTIASGEVSLRLQ